MDFDRTADDLYGLRPEGFTAARNERAARARSDGERDLAKRIRQLRRPTVSAWVVNLLVREAGDVIGELLELGGQLREAQGKRRGEQLRALTERRREVVPAVASKGQRLAGDAGYSVGESALREVEATLEAALADPDASEAVRAGRLTTALSYSGLGPLDSKVGSDRAMPPTGTPEALTERTRPAGRQRGGGSRDHDGSKAVKEERQALSDAQAAVHRLEQDDQRTRTNEDAARERKDAAEHQVTQLEADLDRAREAAETAASELRDAAGRSEDVASDLAAARQRVEDVRARLDELGDR
ncbi:MAG: hypothetical protein ACRDMV_00420 [Streptosporangiales bacterium]